MSPVIESADFPEINDRGGERQTGLTILPSDPSGDVHILIDTPDGWHSLYASADRWRQIIREIERRLPSLDAHLSGEDREYLRMGGDR